MSAVNSAGEGVLSNERSATPAALATIPGAPTLDAADAGDGSVRLSWTAPASDGGSALVSYRIYRATTSGNETLLAALGTETTYTDMAAANGTTYFYVVSAVNGVGEGLPSSERSATPRAPATAPAAPALTSAAPGNGSVTLSWTPASSGGSSVTGYRVYRGTTSGGETLVASLADQTTFADSAVENGTTYYYVVSALNAVGEGATSNELAATPATTPSPPSLVSAVPGNSVTLNWTTPAPGGSAITGYKIYRGTVSGGETFLASVGPVTTYTDESTTYGTTYYFRVSAVNALGEGNLSNELAATPVAPDVTPPSKPLSLQALLAGTSQLALNWAAATDDVGVTGYRVYRDRALVATVSTAHYLDSGLAARSSHSYQVVALDAAGNVSAASASLTGKVAAVAKGSTGTLAGVVYDAAGKQLAGAVVSLRLPSGTLKTAATSGAGVWKLSSLPPASYSIVVSFPGFQAQTLNLNAAAGRTSLAVTVLTA